MRITQSKLVTAADMPAGLITNAMVSATAAIDARKLDLSIAELITAEAAGTSVILSLAQQAMLYS